MRGMWSLIAVTVVLCSSLAVTALDNGLSLTPALGYNTWNCFGGSINETLIRSTADLLVDLGLAKAGYQYLVIDDAWSNPQRGPDSEVQPNSQRFPSGMAKLADYVHSKGLKFGMYSDAGALTCLGYPGSRGHEEQDAAAFASWGVDYLKYDNCFAPASDWVVDRYTAMRDALNKTGRPILYSLCDWGVGDPWTWGPKVGNSWRTTGDIANSWLSMLGCLDNTVGLARYAGPGGWNDPDMLEVGNGRLTHNEERAHFALWALLKAPLLIGADLRTLSKDSLAVLTAAEVVAVNQDPLGVAGDLVWKEGPIEVYAGPLKGGSRAVVLFNRHVAGTQYPHSNITVTWEMLGLNATSRATVRDLYAERDLGTYQGEFKASVDIHDGLALRITPAESRAEYDSWRPWHWQEASGLVVVPTPRLIRRPGQVHQPMTAS